MGYDKPVLEALQAAQELTELFEADFDVDRGGFTWWHDYGLDGVARTGLMDYLYGLLCAVEENLRSAAIHLHDLRTNRYTDDYALLKHMRENGRIPDYRMRTDAEAQREARTNAHEAGVFRATGSILDTLAGVVVGVGGLKFNIMMADLGSLQPLAKGADYPNAKVRKRLGLTEQSLDLNDPQGNLLRATRSSLLEAGPDGWLEWTQFSRNDRVHRASRMHTGIFTEDGKMARPFPRQPDHAETLAFRMANDVRKVHLTEDSVVTLEGVVGSVNAAVVGVLLACAALWRTRKAQPALITQPEWQWASAKPPRATTFDGYAADTIKMQRNPALAVSPRTARRLQAAKVMDGDHPTTT
ncbi:hypothetical protein [Amycolatopsis sp. NPDC051371]|uniref:hypothetical protein n=1 Tax=Amycolatopsis sp. NPDC051371 TaxID=3155800 RepID=UPI003416DB84